MKGIVYTIEWDYRKRLISVGGILIDGIREIKEDEVMFLLKKIKEI